MKFIILAAIFAIAFSGYTMTTASTTLALTAAVGTSTNPTKTNGTCNVTVTHAAPFTSATGGPTTTNNGLWMMTSTSATSTATTDFGILCTYATSNNAATTVTTTFVTTPSCALYIGTGTTYSANTTLTPYNPSVTTAATASFVLTLSYANSNWTTQNFTKDSFSMSWIYISSETATAYTYTTTIAGTAGGSTSTLSLSACNTALKAYTSGSTVQNSVLGSILALSFF